MMKLVFCIFYIFLFLGGTVGSSTLYATSWQGRLYNEALPSRIVTVDKTKQEFYLYNKEDSLMKLAYHYPCSTGKKLGDKQKINDLRTPEGIYFVVYKIDKGLDFQEYGGIAYTLNYPNPVDKLRGKTGHGIWIHSKGDGIKPNITRGCVAIDLKNIETVGPLLTSGTPVMVGAKMDNTQPFAKNATVDHLRRRMEMWTRAWASRSNDFFEFYDAHSYTKAMSESFVHFRANKERLFKLLDWINIFNREVHVLEGPGYWVTWSEQYYRAANNHTTEGIVAYIGNRGRTKYSV